MIGTTVSHYRILEKLGEGGMGVVYKARDLKLDRFVALKFLPPHFSSSEQDKLRFVQEAKAASALNHPNVCTVHDIQEHDGQMFIVMAFYEGRTVKDKVNDRPLSLDEAIDIAVAVGQGLAKAHERGVTHRDIKSENIMVTRDGGVKIMDFGLASIVGASTLTKTGQTIGTLHYMSPEQARGEKVDHRSDIWSLGTVIYEMVTGQLPFKSQYNEAVVYSILNERPRPLSALRTGIPLELEKIVDKCLEKDSSNRYQHVDDLIVDLKSAERQIGKQGVAVSPTFVPSRRWLVYAVIIIVLAISIILLLPFFKEKEKSIKSVAVLPLENLSRDPEQEYFADGMTEALIMELSKIGALKVISRTSIMQYKQTKKHIPDIATELGADGLIEGSVAREGGRVRISVQLIDGSTDKHLWAEQYEREMRGILALQSEVARAIAKEIHVKVSPQEQMRLETTAPVNPEAHEAYMRGLYHSHRYTETDIKKSFGYFQEAVNRAPDYALAHSGLAIGYLSMGNYSVMSSSDAYKGAKAATLKAIELDESLAEAHSALAELKHYYEWDHAGAEKEYRRAIALKPNFADAHGAYSLYLTHFNRVMEAEAEAKIYRDLDPTSISPITTLGFAYHYAARQSDQAIEQYRKAIALDPSQYDARWHLALAYLITRRCDEAMTEIRSWKPEGIGKNMMLSQLALAYGFCGHRPEALETQRLLLEGRKHRLVRPYALAWSYIALGEKKQALDWLEKAYAERDDWMNWLLVDPFFDILREDPRFLDLLKKIGMGK